MLIGWTEEQLQVRGSARAFVTDFGDEAAIRRLMATEHGHDEAAWGALLELGFLGLTVPEGLGGAGGSLVDQGVVLEELGRAVYGGAYFSTAVLAVQALLPVAEDPAAAELLTAIATYGLRVTLALTEDSGRWDGAGVRAIAERGSLGWRLSGEKTFVPDGAGADALLVVARTSSGIALFAVDADADGLTRTSLPTLDQTRKQARVHLDATPGRLLGVEGGAWPLLETALHKSALALAAEQAGGAQSVLDRTVEHARTREQFGRPIGSFQAVQHKCADMLVQVEAAKSAAYYGLAVARDDAPELAVVAALAKVVCSETYRRTANEAIQILGGIGITWEHWAHLYFKRARSSDAFLGAPAVHRERLARHLEV